MQALFTSVPGATDFYPASGCRVSYSGGLYGVGSDGYAWSSSPASATSENGSNLYFTSSGVYPESNHARAFGIPVRCVQE